MQDSILTTVVKDIDGEVTTLEKFAGNVLLIVNVASKCGLTPQYEQLENIQKAWVDRGFMVLGFPCNQFLEQEPGSDEEIWNFEKFLVGRDGLVIQRFSPDMTPEDPIVMESIKLALAK